MAKVFEFDPFELLLNIYIEMGGKRPIIAWDYLNTDENEPKYGETIFADDGTIHIHIDCNIPVSAAVEIFTHELAHALVGIEHEHDAIFEKTNDTLFEKYNSRL